MATTKKITPKPKIAQQKHIMEKTIKKSSAKTSQSPKKIEPTKKSNTSLSVGPLGVKPYELKKNESYMTDGQLRHFEEILNLWKQQLMQEVDRTIYDLQDVTNYSDPVDRASQEEEFNVRLRERDRERKLLKKIDEALASIQNGDYGYCDECGAEIGIRRLEARPTATQCIECKTIAEIREKQIGG